MCLYVKSVRKVTTKPIRVIKTLYKLNDCLAKSVCKEKKYKFTNYFTSFRTAPIYFNFFGVALQESELVPELLSDKTEMVNIGIHSYLVNFIEVLTGEHLYIAVIPKNASYYFGNSNKITSAASNRLLIFKNKISYYFWKYIYKSIK